MITPITRAILAIAQENFGASYLLEGLRWDGSPSVWVDFKVHQSGSEQALVAELVKALKEQEGNVECGYWLKRFAKQHYDGWVLISGAEYAPDLAQQLLEYSHAGGCKVALSCKIVDFSIDPSHAVVVLREDDLALTLDEAIAQLEPLLSLPPLHFDPSVSTSDEGLVVTSLFNLADFYLEREQVRIWWREQQGALEGFLGQCQHALGLFSAWKPTAQGLVPLDANLAAQSPTVWLERLLDQGKLREAFEIALVHQPARALELLEKAAHLYHANGQNAKLYHLLNHLTKAEQSSEVALFWRTSTAIRLGKRDEMRLEVEHYLEVHEAPELRAIYAGVLCYIETYLEQSERAAKAARTPLTLYQWGTALRYHGKAEQAEQVLREALRLAERSGHGYEKARNAEGVANYLTTRGRYREALHFWRYALKNYHHYRLGNPALQANLFRGLLYVKRMTNSVEGLELLATTLTKLQEMLPSYLALPIRHDLCYYDLSQGRLEQARVWTEEDLSKVDRLHSGTVLRYVRILLEQNEYSLALEQGERSWAITRGEFESLETGGNFAYGMALSLTDPQKSLTHLEVAQTYMQSRHVGSYLQATLYLAQARLSLGDLLGAKAELDKIRPYLCEMSENALSELAGPPEDFKKLFSLLLRQDNGLSLELLGQNKVYLNGKLLNLNLRPLEVLTLLIAHPKGLTGEQLMLLVYGDGGNINTLKPLVLKLKAQVPIETKPYCVAIPFEADFLKCSKLLERGQVTEALKLYQGPLLPSSEAVGIVHLREELETRLRHAVLESGDGSLIYILAQYHPEDLELWETLLEILEPKNLHRITVEARVKLLRKTWNT